MKVNELIAKLMVCPQDYDIVLANVEKLDSEAGDNEFQIRLDQPINQIFKDENEREILLFTTESRIEINHDGVSEVVAHSHQYNGERSCSVYAGIPPMSNVPMSNTPAYLETGGYVGYAEQGPQAPIELATDS